VYVCMRSIFNLRVRSTWRSSNNLGSYRQGRRAALEHCSACPADSMDKALRHFGHIVVNDMGYVIHVACRNSRPSSTAANTYPLYELFTKVPDEQLGQERCSGKAVRKGGLARKRATVVE
jgi:hypothetical protein